MSTNIVLKKGLDLPISGEAELRLSKTVTPDIVAVEPTGLKGFSPRLLVKEGDKVLCGSPVLADKKNAQILLASPVSGTVKQIVRGEKRKLLAVLLQADEKQEYLKVDVADKLDADKVKETILAGGLWPFLIQRPYGIVADPALTPKAIFVSAFNSAPLAADLEFTLGDRLADIQKAVSALAKIAKVYVGVKPGSKFAALKDAEINTFEGKHPAGNVGVQISHISPIAKGDTVWTVSLEGLAAIGALLSTGNYKVARKVAVAGPAAEEKAYVEALPGTPVSKLVAGSTEGKRIISGDVLTGSNVGAEGYLGFFDNCITVLKEGTEKELLGWANPIRSKLFSASRSYFSWLCPKKKYDMDTNLHGGPRAFVMNDGFYQKVLPMDIYPIYLTKACLAGDIDGMEKYGIYEVLPEDLALCEYIDPSKNDIQSIIAKGIDLMLKEMA